LNFLDLVDIQGNEKGGEAISKQTFHKRLSEALQYSCKDGVLDDYEIAHLSDFCFQKVSQSSSPVSQLGRKEYQQASLCNENVDVMDMAKLFDANRRRQPGEILFFPTAISRTLQKSLEAQRGDPKLQMQSKIPEGSHTLNEVRKRKGNQIPKLNLAESGQEVTGKELDELTQGFQRVQGELDKMSAKLELMEAKVNLLDISHDLKTSTSSTNSESEAQVSVHQKSTPCATVQQSADDVQSAEEFLLDVNCDQNDLRKEADTVVLKSLEECVLSIQRNVAEIQIKQQKSIEEAVSCATAAAVSEIMAELQSVRLKMESHASCFLPVTPPILDQPRPGVTRKEDGRSTKQDNFESALNPVLPDDPQMLHASDTTAADGLALAWGEMCSCARRQSHGHRRTRRFV